MVQLLTVQNFNVSRDGFGAGENQSFEHPFGHANPAEMFAWAGATASWPNRTDPGGSRGLDDYLTRDFANDIGAEIMGRNKFSPHRGPWADHEWLGWWGDEPLFHTPVFVMTHYERPSFTLSDTTFHFANDPANLLAVQGQANQDKGDREPASWMPPNSAFHCQYAMQFIAVLRGYALPVDAPSAAALRAAVSTCPTS